LRVKGFKGGAVEAGIKYQDRKDLGLIYSDYPARVAGVFTRNEIKAAPVLLDMERLGSGNGLARAIVVNSGNANACTGHRGLIDAEETCGLVADRLGLVEEDILVCSTGVIGEPLPMDKIREAVPTLVEAISYEGLEDVARAIMTTDTVHKMAFRTLDIDGCPVSLAGMAKGAGMIGPNMGPPQATMLSFVLTDANVEGQWWQDILTRAVDESFNRIVVDGDTSTNDTVLALANGCAANSEIAGGGAGILLEKALHDLLMDLALQIVRDAEGGTKCVHIHVKGARDETEADVIARTIANSPLVKTAFFGEDPNWGRILAAAGRSGFALDDNRLELRIGDIVLVSKGGYAGKDNEAKAAEIMKEREFSIVLDLGLGDGSASIVTSDLSVEYVRINADYRT